MMEGEETRQWIFQILRTRLAYKQALNRVLHSHHVDVTFEMLHILHELGREEGLSQQTLAERTAKNKTCLTNLMCNLEKRGYIRRVGDPNDHRSKQVYLTAEGRACQRRMEEMVQPLYSYVQSKVGKETGEEGLAKLKELSSALESF